MQMHRKQRESKILNTTRETETQKVNRSENGKGVTCFMLKVRFGIVWKNYDLVPRKVKDPIKKKKRNSKKDLK